MVLISECPPGDLSGLLADDYPHRIDTGVASDQTYAVRMALFSRKPISDAAVQQGPGPNQRPWLTLRVEIDGRTLDIAGAHPVPPYGKLTAERDAHIGKVATHLREPFVLAGLIPLFYGGRKMAYSSMGLGLVDDARPPRA
jgi:hypothetical protein